MEFSRTDHRAASRTALVGTWRLRSWQSVFDDGSAGLVLGTAPDGLLVYTDAGTMITTIAGSTRSRIDGDDVLGGPDAQRLGAMATFIAYAGTFRLDGTDVLHQVEISPYPNWVGGTQRRHASLSTDGRTLVLTTDPMAIGGRPGIHRLEWERVGD